MKTWFLVVALLACLTCAAAEKPRSGPSKQEMKQAQKSFDHALDLEKQGLYEQALDEAANAANLAPNNMEYITARELLRGQVAGTYIEHGNLLAEIGDNKRAVEHFKAALAVDPQNGYAQQRLHDVSPPEDPDHEHVLQLLASVDEVMVVPKPGRQDFHIKGTTQALYDAIGKAFGIGISYDQSLASKPVRFDVDNIDFFTAMGLAGKVTKTFWAPVSDKLAIVANDTQDLRKQYERMSLQTYYVNNLVAQTDLNDIVNVMRSVFDLRYVIAQPTKNMITVRGPKSQLDQLTEIIDEAMQARPEVLIEIKAYELSYDNRHQYGLTLPTDFTIFNVFSEIRRVLGSAAGPIIDQFRQTGAIDPSKVPASAAGNLQGSPLLQPFIFFGKGLGLTGITVSPISGKLSYSSSAVKTLEHITVRSSVGAPANFKIGTRFPIQTSAFSNVTLSRNGNPVVGSSFPSFQYEDIGLIFKATPHLNSDDNVNLDLELEIKGLGSQSLNDVPVITDRAYKGNITVKDGESSVLAGSMTEQKSHTGSGYPGIGQVPILGSIFSTNSNDHTHSEILIVVTPHIIRKPFKHIDSSGLWVMGQ
jgi:general secretion pathway protein D